MARFTTEVGRRRRRYRALWAVSKVTLAVCGLAAFLLFFFLYFPLFRVRSVLVEGLGYISKDRVDSLLKARITGNSPIKNLLGMRNMLVWPDALTSQDLKLLPEASSITIQKDQLRGRIVVRVTPREHRGIWCFKRVDPPTCFWFDTKGTITRTPATEGSLILVVDDYARATIPSNNPVIAPEFIDNLFSIFDALARMNVNTKEIRVDDLESQEVHVPTFIGPTILFSLRFPATNTPAALQALEDKTPISKLEYIDFRIENRIYYK